MPTELARGGNPLQTGSELMAALDFLIAAANEGQELAENGLSTGFSKYLLPLIKRHSSTSKSPLAESVVVAQAAAFFDISSTIDKKRFKRLYG